MKSSLALAIAALAMTTFVTIAFVNSIPNFCASPDGGNWIIQPLVCH